MSTRKDLSDFLNLYIKHADDNATDNKELINIHLSTHCYNNDEDEERRDCVVIICALPEELSNAEEAFKIQKNSSKRDKEKEYGFRYSQGVYQKFDIFLIRAPGKGMVAAATITASAVAAFHPKLVAMTGICAGRFGKTKLGDLIIAKQTFDYEAGKIEKEQRRFRPDPVQLSKGIKTAIEYMHFPKQELLNRIPHTKKGQAEGLELNIHFKHLASGSSVLCNPKVFEDLTQLQDEVYGVDMEAFGIAYAADYLNTEWIVIKGIQDYANEEKSKVEDKYRECAAYSSALLLQCLLDSEDFLNSI